MKTLTFEQQCSLFGNPLVFLNHDGTIDHGWEAMILGLATLPATLPLSWDRGIRVSRFRCHRKLVTRFEAVYREIHKDMAAWASIGDFGGCYNFRVRRGQKRVLSKHSWGTAVDQDVADNPDGSVGNVHPHVIRCFEDQGFVWGGNWQGKDSDPMHFEFADASKLGT